MINYDIRRIKCAKELQEMANGALKIAQDALTPKITDKTLISEIYELFKDYIKIIKPVRHPERRREFLFIIAYLYCPSVLIGGTMPKGFRTQLKNVLNVESPSSISNYTSDLMFLYNHYQDFREIVEGAYSFIVEKMNLDFPDWTGLDWNQQK